MNFLEKALLRQGLKPVVSQTTTGVAVLEFAAFRLLPASAHAYAAQADAAYRLLPGVTDVQTDLTQGSIRLTYDPEACDIDAIRRWTERIADAILSAADLPADQAIAQVQAQLEQAADRLR